MPNISIVKVEDPSSLWGQVQETTELYDRLLAQINDFYHNITQDEKKLKPASLEEGELCVVYWSAMNSWCRALVESIITDTASYRACCLLVDHGEWLVVSSDQIRIALLNFLQLPFRFRRFHLGGIRPTTLRVSVQEDKAVLIPSSQWDSSATLYLHNLLQVSTQTEAVLLQSESDSTSIELYVTFANVKICVNDDLVAKKFAVYTRALTDDSEPEEVDRFPVMLPSSMLYLSLTLKKMMAQTCLPPGSQALPAAGWPVALTTPQCQHHDGSGDREKLLYADGKTRKCSDCVSANSEPTITHEQEHGDGGEETLALTGRNIEQNQSASDSSEDTDLSLAANGNNNHGLLSRRVGMKSYRTVKLKRRLQTSAQDRKADTLNPCKNRRRLFILHLPVMMETTRASEEDQICSRLLSWLNPESPNTDCSASDCLQVVPNDPILVHSAHPIEAWTNLDDAPISNRFRWVLQCKQLGTLTPSECHSWPAVARGCNTIVISNSAEQPLCYLIPLLTHMLLNSIFISFTPNTGPIAVLLCPGWERVQLVYDLLEELKVTSSLQPAVVLLGVGEDEAKACKIPKNCRLLLTTPFSFVRLLSCRCFLFLRLYHLVLDQADQLFTLAPDQMTTILQHFQRVTSSEEKPSSPQQIIAVAKRWTSHVEGLLNNHMSQPCIVVTVPKEAALYADVQQIVLMTVETSKISILLSALDFNPNVGQKTLIVTNSAQEAEDVFQAVKNKSAYCLMIHEGLIHQSNFVIQQWRKDVCVGSHVILVITSETLKCLRITDASCVVHYGFPSSPKAFGIRLFCMAENFRNLSKRDQADSCTGLTKSVLLISDRNAHHIIGLLRYLERTNASLPPELLTFSQEVHMAREDQKTSMPLCSYLKSFGVCRDRSACPDRHKVMLHLDQSVLPASGIIEVVPLYIKTASVFFGRIVEKDDGGFPALARQMNSYYADKKPGAKDVVEGGLYAMQEDDDFHRVKVLSVSETGERLFFSVIVRFIDVGKEQTVRSHQILQLPDQFLSLPPQAVEIVLCGVKPVDAEVNWHPKVIRAISKKIRGRQHRAKAVFSLGNTVFVDPMVCLSQVPGMKTMINEYNVQSEILNTGMGTKNQDHLDLLKALYQSTSHLPGPVSLDDLGEAFSHLVAPLHLELCHPDSPVKPSLVPASPLMPSAEPHLVPMCDHTSLLGNQLVTVQTNSHEANLHSVGQMCRYGSEGELGPNQTSQSTSVNSCDNGEDGRGSSSESIHQSSFHPQIRWYQTSKSVIVTVKLTNPEAQCCDFYPDRVVYSGRVDGRTYRADLQLQHNIATDSCRWEMKSSEPVIQLVKQQQGDWEKLLKNKNIFVSYDMEHLEDKEDRIPKGRWFLVDPKEDDCYVTSESDSD
ncbi:putative ATP-dependent RNA helicase TDRD12 [Antennarius striatus]|uniref:putative ATP-dependent RNA helicase TDRD12 n=1 Tax=Antennarius striatus TaxID=241820 RepID=UPI0035ADB30E